MFIPTLDSLKVQSTLSRSLVIITVLLAPGSATAMQGQAGEGQVATGARVVVVRGEDHRPTMTWSLLGPRSYLGVQMVELTPELRRHFGVPEDTGVLVSRVIEESPAATAGIEVGDIVTRIEGKELGSPSDLVHAVAQHESGETVDLEIWRQGKTQEISVQLTEREGRWVDIRQFHVPNEHLQTIEIPDIEIREAIELDAETLNQAIERLNTEMSSPEWIEHIRHFREHQDGLLEKIDFLERRLKELEKRLEELPKDQ